MVVEDQRTGGGGADGSRGGTRRGENQREQRRATRTRKGRGDRGKRRPGAAETEKQRELRAIRRSQVGESDDDVYSAVMNVAGRSKNEHGDVERQGKARVDGGAGRR